MAELKAGRLRFAVEDPSAPENFPRVFFVWRSNLLGSSGKGQEYFLSHLVGASHDGPLAEPLPEGERPAEVRWRDEIPKGKLDLLVNVDFRMTTTGAVLRHRAAGRHLVREARPVDDRHAPVRPLLQPGRPSTLGGAHRLGHVRGDRARLLRARRRAPRCPSRRRRHAGAPRQPRRDRAAARRGARLARGRVRARPGAHDAHPRRGRA